MLLPEYQHLPGTAEAVEGGALVFGWRRQEGIKLGEDMGAIDNILVPGEGNYTTGLGVVVWFCWTILDTKDFWRRIRN